MSSKQTIGIDTAKRVFFLHGEDARLKASVIHEYPSVTASSRRAMPRCSVRGRTPSELAHFESRLIDASHCKMAHRRTHWSRGVASAPCCFGGHCWLTYEILDRDRPR